MDKSKFQQSIASGQNILVVLHQNPNFDQISAALSLYLSLTNYGKKVSIFCPTPMLVEFNRLVGVDRVSSELGDKNLTVTLVDYPAQNIERVSYNIENGQMQLTIIPKPQVSVPSPSQVSASLGGMSADTLLLFDGEGLEGELAKVSKQVEIVDPLSSCVSETVGNLLFESNLPIDQDITGNLLLGITNTTGNFTSNRVRPETFELVARLMRVRGGVARPQSTERQTEEQQTPQDWFEPKIYKGSTLP